MIEDRQKPKRLKRIELSSLRLGLVKELPQVSSISLAKHNAQATAFFIEKIEGRYPLNPLRWIENSTAPLQSTLETVEPNIQVSRIE